MDKLNQHNVYIIARKPVDPVLEQINFGFTVSYNLSWPAHCLKVVRTVNGALQLSKRAFPSPSPSLEVQLYTPYIRLLLEFGIPA